MAERRMFSSKIVCSDAFTDMPFSAQALYFQLNMEADDDGFLNRAKRIQRTIGASDTDLNILFEKRFILGFKNGVIAIKHWRMNNQIRKDRYTPTQYQEEFNSLEIRSDGAYTEKESEEVVDSLATTWQPDGNHLETQYSLGKSSIVQYSTDYTPFPATEEPEPEEIIVEQPTKDTVSCQQIVNLYHNICGSYPKVRSLSEARKKAIKARLKTYSLEDFEEMFSKAEASDFLKGKNGNNWSANFDWLIKDANMAKVLDGNYDNKNSSGRKEIVPEWCSSNAGLKKLHSTLISDDPDLKARAERLRESLGG